MRILLVIGVILLLFILFGKKETNNKIKKVSKIDTLIVKEKDTIKQILTKIEHRKEYIERLVVKKDSIKKELNKIDNIKYENIISIKDSILVNLNKIRVIFSE